MMLARLLQNDFYAIETLIVGVVVATYLALAF
jgi:hypothetical protein